MLKMKLKMKINVKNEIDSRANQFQNLNLIKQALKSFQSLKS